MSQKDGSATPLTLTPTIGVDETHLHPMLRMFLEINWRPFVSSPQPVTLTIMMTETVIILQPILQHQFRSFLTTLPPRRHNTSRWLTLEFCNQFVTLIHYSRLLLKRHGNWVFVTVAMQTDFMAGISNHAAFFAKGLETVAGLEAGLIRRGADGCVMVEADVRESQARNLKLNVATW